MGVFMEDATLDKVLDFAGQVERDAKAGNGISDQTSELLRGLYRQEAVIGNYGRLAPALVQVVGALRDERDALRLERDGLRAELEEMRGIADREENDEVSS
jgi:regulator of replication initiation timing